MGKKIKPKMGCADGRNHYRVSGTDIAVLARLPHYRSVTICGNLAVCQTTTCNHHGLLRRGMLCENTAAPDWRQVLQVRRGYLTRIINCKNSTYLMPEAEKDHTADIVVSCVVFPVAPLEDITQKLLLFSIIPK